MGCSDRSKEGIQRVIGALRGHSRYSPEGRAAELIEDLAQDYDELRVINARLREELAIARSAQPAPKGSNSKGRL